MKLLPNTHSQPRVAGELLALLLAATLLLLPTAASAQTISDDCAECHNTIYQNWKASGHPYKLMKGDIAQNRPIPLPEGYSWDDISYVIGGYKWKSRYMDTNGYIITEGLNGEFMAGVDKVDPGNTQYNYLVGFWSNYHADEADGTKPYNCGSCHTTGWVANDNPTDLSGNQDGLPGIHGTFEQGGIQCIQCHGGAQHADLGMVDRSADACGACHYRTAAPGDDNVIPASSGWIKHHEQYNEHLAGPHGSEDCVMCHDPHKRGEYSIWEEGSKGHESGAECGVNCHSSKMETYMDNAMYDYGVTCNDCHMPFATKSAQPQGPNMGDVQTHIFYINSDPVDKNAMFTEDGSAVLLDTEGKASVTLDFVCQRCHENASLEELSKFATDFHVPGASLQNVGVNTGLTGTWWDAQRAGEGFLLEVTMLNDAPFMFMSFYTYDDQGNQVFLVAVSNAVNGTTAELDVSITSGQFWGDAFDPSIDAESPWGTGTIDFSTCGEALISLRPDNNAQASGFTNHTFSLTRTFENISCPAFDNLSGVASN